jgi:hypothetical protein
VRTARRFERTLLQIRGRPGTLHGRVSEHDDGGQQAHSLQIRRWAGLARTDFTLLGVVDPDTLKALDGAIQEARAGGFAIALDLTQLAGLPATVIDDLLASSEDITVIRIEVR